MGIKEVLEELAWHQENNKPYYRPLTHNGFATLACMQWFDEYDYSESRFFKDNDGEAFKFSTEEEGIKWLHENIKNEKIDPEYLRVKTNELDDFF